VRAVRASQLREIRVDEIGAADMAWIVALLLHAGRAVHAVVDDDEHDRQPILDGGGGSWPFIRKQPSPFHETTVRCGWTSLAATTDGTP
jgi:hypothetical protein